MTYLLDTNAVSQLLRGHRIVTLNVRRNISSAMCISAIAMSELWAGILNAPDEKRLTATLLRLGMDVLAFDAADARCAGELRALLWRIGQPIGPLDTLIAGHALARGLTVVTHNTREFGREPGLRVEDWEV